MPHQHMAIDCQCGAHYCPVCERKCLKCERIDIASDAVMRDRARMRRHSEGIADDALAPLREEWHLLEQRAGMEAHRMEPGGKVEAKIIDADELMRLQEVRERLFLDFFDLIDPSDRFTLQQDLM